MVLAIFVKLVICLIEAKDVKSCLYVSLKNVTVGGTII